MANRKFSIELAKNSGGEILSFSSEVIEYFEEFIEVNILKPCEIMLDTVWNYRATIFFNEDKYYSQNIPKDKLYSVSNGVMVIPPYHQTKLRLKTFSVQFYTEVIKNNGQDIFKGFCKMMYDFIITFFRSYYPSVRIDFLHSLQYRIDWEYLNSISNKNE